MEKPTNGETFFVKGRIIFDGMNDERGRTVFVADSARKTTIALCLKSMLHPEKIPEEITGREIDMIGRVAGEITDAPDSLGPKITLVNIRCCNIFSDSPERGRVYV